MNTYLLPIGDWSNDGHGHCEWYSVLTEKPLQAIFDAYYKAKELYPKIDPGEICDVYQDSTIDQNTLQEIKDAGFTGFDHYDENEGIEDVVFATYVVWYINLGDKDLNLSFLAPVNDTNKIISWNDKSGKDFPSFGYGLFHGR